MSFLYPLFLAAGITLGIPVLIHLFNLRKYKTVLFPHTRFLKNIQLNSQKQSQVRYKWLLASRLLFLAFLIFAFAQPFFKNKDATSTGKKLQIIYLDNSHSMSAKKGARSMLEIAKEAASRQVRKAAPGTRFVLLTNDKPASYRAEQADKVFAAIQATEISATTATINKTLAAAQSVLKNEGGKDADMYYYSDFQQSAFPANPPKELMEHITFYGLPVQPHEVENVYVDTAYLTTPVLQTGRSNFLVVHTRSAGKAPAENPVLSLSVNGQVKSAASLNLTDKTESIDTLSFQVNGNEWQQVLLTLNDASMRFDDTFRIAARSAPNLNVLVLNEGQLNPYIQAAFRAYNGFRLNQSDISAIPADRKQYNLVILNGITRIDETLGKTLNEALQEGQSICIFPGRTTNTQLLNEGLKQMGDIQITGIDTSVQTASLLQQGSALVKDLFEKIPDNVQLPVANWHYILSAGLSANQQSVLGFRNGDPLLARYTPSRGQLYLCATSADLQSGNFPGSYFFTPFLYLMAMQSGGGSVFAITSGTQEPVYLNLANVTERNTIHAFAKETDVIPPQRPNGAGLDVYLGQAVQQPGFYLLAATGSDTTQVALNQSKNESLPSFRDIGALQKDWKGDNVKWMTITESGSRAGNGSNIDFPLWKVCVILALIMLALETFLLARKQVVVAA
ncbi:MAG: BatA and WFA domain-containing protein [Taibaiella sp.]|nr:BatA and WFA domain-containing protein [Taibaiella sp.]